MAIQASCGRALKDRHGVQATADDAAEARRTRELVDVKRKRIPLCCKGHDLLSGHRMFTELEQFTDGQILGVHLMVIHVFTPSRILLLRRHSDTSDVCIRRVATWPQRWEGVMGCSEQED